jgi:hypothetical protein
MSKVIPMLGLVAILAAILTALVFFDIAVMLPALYALGAGIYLAISKDWRRYVPGGSAILFSIIGILGTLGNISTEDGGIDFGIGTQVGQAFVVVALLGIAGASIMLMWDDFEPAWLNFVFAGLWLLAFVFAFAFRANFNIQTSGLAYLMVLPILAMMAAPILHLREG